MRLTFRMRVFSSQRTTPKLEFKGKKLLKYIRFFLYGGFKLWEIRCQFIVAVYRKIETDPLVNRRELLKVISGLQAGNMVSIKKCVSRYRNFWLLFPLHPCYI